MAIPNTKATLKDYCLRALGSPVIDVNVDEDQVDDRLDEALQYFSQYHYDGIERMYLKHEVTQAEIDRAKTNASATATDKVDNSITAAWLEGKNFIPIPDTVVSIVNVFPFTDKSNLNMFDIRYQLRLNDLYDFSSTSMIHYQMSMMHLDFLDHILVGEKPYRFNQHQNRLYIDMDFNSMSTDDYIVIDCFRALDPDDFTKVYNDPFVKMYLVALTKRQWGQNLIKFRGVKLPGGLELNGREIYEDGERELESIKQKMQLEYELPPFDFIG